MLFRSGICHRAAERDQNLIGRRLLLQCFSKVILRFGEFAGPLVELLLQIGCRGTARSRYLLAALELRRLAAARRHHSVILRCTGLTSGLGTNAIDVTNGHPLIKPSYDAQDHARGSERYHTSEGIERGLDRVRARARTLMSFDEYCLKLKAEMHMSEQQS